MYYLDLQLLAFLIRKKRGHKRFQDIATEIGNVSASTLCRVERKKMPDMENFLFICQWLEVPPANLFKTTEKITLNPVDAIAIQLYAGENIDPETADALIRLVKLACQRSVAIG